MENEQSEIDRNLGILAKSSMIVFVGIFLSKLFTYLYRIIIARYYGPEVYGLFSLAIMVVGFFIAFASLGLIEGLVRFIPIYRAKEEKNKISYLIKTSRIILLVSGIFSAAALWILSDFISIGIFHEPKLSIFLKTFSILIPINIFMGFYFSILRSYEKISAYSFGMNILQSASKLSFIGIFILLGVSTSKTISFSYILAIFISLIFAYFYSKIKLSKNFMESTSTSKTEKKDILTKLLFYSWPLVLFSIIGSIMFWVDTILIGYFENAYLVGIYNAAVPIAALLVISQEVFVQMFFPMITREMYAKKIQTVRELSKQVTKWICIINIPVLIIILLFPEILINFFFGAEYIFAKNSLRFLALGQSIYAITIVSNNLLLSRGKSKLILGNIIIVSIINFSLNYFLIPIYGITGAAFSTFISLSILSFLAVVENYYFNRIFPFRRKLINIFISAAIPAIMLLWIRNILEVNLVLLILLGILFVCFYLVLMLLTKALDKNDFNIFKKILRGITKSNISKSFIQK